MLRWPRDLGQLRANALRASDYPIVPSRVRDAANAVSPAPLARAPRTSPSETPRLPPPASFPRGPGTAPAPDAPPDRDTPERSLETQLARQTTTTMSAFAMSASAARPASRVAPGGARRSPAARGAVRARAGSKSMQLPFRVGHGFDLHRLELVSEMPELKLILGGVEIAHDRGCVAHSDGDVLLHCVVDAITGALGLPDIGQLFPDNDPKWKGCTSDVFVAEACRLMREEGYEIGNIDCTIIAQRPKISPHKPAIKANLCKMLGCDESAVNVKAKTHEKVDSLGENRSIACHTVVMLMKV